MASWGNQSDNRYEQDMDSNGYKLKVRNSGTPAPGDDWLVEIAQTGGNSSSALKINGQMAIYAQNGATEEHCGTLFPVVGIGDTPNELEINGGLGDPDVRIGRNDSATPPVPGNTTVILGHQIGIGRIPDSTVSVSEEKVRIASPVVIPDTGNPQNPNNALLSVDGSVQAHKVDYPGTSGTSRIIEIGKDNATQLELGYDSLNRSVPTVIHGALTVERATTLSGGIDGNLTVNSGQFTVNNLATVQHAHVTNNLGVDGNVTTQGNLSANGNINTDGNLEVHGTISKPNSMEISSGRNRFYVQTLFSQGEPLLSTMNVEHTSTNSTQSAVNIQHLGTGANATALHVTGNKAIVADGQTFLNGPLTVSGLTIHSDDVKMQNRSVIFRSTGTQDLSIRGGRDRLEFRGRNPSVLY